MTKKCVFLIFVAYILVLGACFSPWKGDEGTVSVSVGGGEANGGSRSIVDDKDGLNHTITFSDGPGPRQEQKNVKYGDTVSFSVMCGQWTISVTTFLNGEECAGGSRTIDIKPGPNGVIAIPISLWVTKSYDNNDGVDVGTLTWAVMSARDSGKTIDIDIRVAEITLDFSLPTIPDSTPKSITIKAQKPVTIRRANATNALFNITSDGTLILGGAGSAPITIDGGKSPTAIASLITVDGGTLIINEGVTLQNNNINTSGSSIGQGGGVNVGNVGKFYMNGGVIRGNYAYQGGGVYVAGSGLFSITNGIIYGKYEGINANTADTNGGAALYVAASGSAKDGNGNNLLPSGVAMDNTIHVVNGSKQP